MVYDQARPHPKTVTAFSEGKLSPPRRRPGRSPVTEIQVDKQVWKTAMRLAGGDRFRIEVRSADLVTVHNSRDWKRP